MRRYAILRAKKLKTTAKLRSVTGHNLRRATVDNADPGRAEENRFARFEDGRAKWQKGSAEGLPELDQLVAARAASIEARGGKIRSNAVRAIELILTASPGVFRQPEFNLGKWVNESLKFAAKEFGVGNLLQAALHLDEETPHLHVVVIPETTMRETRGNRPKSAEKAASSAEKPTLSASKWLDGRAALSAMQDRYAAAMAPLGLVRGIKRSNSKHQTVRAFYGALEQLEERVEPQQRQVAAAVEALPAPSLVNSPAAVREQRERQEALARQATAAAAQARESERAALLLRQQLQTVQAQLDALGGQPAIEQIEALQVELTRLQARQQAERKDLEQAVAELRAERDKAVRDRETLRTEMQADIEHWRAHAGELEAWGRGWADQARALEIALYGAEQHQPAGPEIG